MSEERRAEHRELMEFLKKKEEKKEERQKEKEDFIKNLFRKIIILYY